MKRNNYFVLILVLICSCNLNSEENINSNCQYSIIEHECDEDRYRFGGEEYYYSDKSLHLFFEYAFDSSYVKVYDGDNVYLSEFISTNPAISAAMYVEVEDIDSISNINIQVDECIYSIFQKGLKTNLLEIKLIDDTLSFEFVKVPFIPE